MWWDLCIPFSLSLCSVFSPRPGVFVLGKELRRGSVDCWCSWREAFLKVPLKIPTWGGRPGYAVWESKGTSLTQSFLIYFVLAVFSLLLFLLFFSGYCNKLHWRDWLLKRMTWLWLLFICIATVQKVFSPPKIKMMYYTVHRDYSTC